VASAELTKIKSDLERHLEALLARRLDQYAENIIGKIKNDTNLMAYRLNEIESRVKFAEEAIAAVGEARLRRLRTIRNYMNNQIEELLHVREAAECFSSAQQEQEHV